MMRRVRNTSTGTPDNPVGGHSCRHGSRSPSCWWTTMANYGRSPCSQTWCSLLAQVAAPLAPAVQGAGRWAASGAAPLAPAVQGAGHWAASGAAPLAPAVRGAGHWAASEAAPLALAVRGEGHWAASEAAPLAPAVRALDAKLDCGRC